jgi:hypothetical protein
MEEHVCFNFSTNIEGSTRKVHKYRMPVYNINLDKYLELVIFHT